MNLTHPPYFTPGSTFEKVAPAVKPDAAIAHPPHYNFGQIEVIDAIEDWGLGFHLGNVVKYVARAKHKESELEDLKKARWYLDRAILQLEQEKNGKTYS